jgi:hypothetical protein
MWIATPSAHGQYCGTQGNLTTAGLYSGLYTGGIYPTYPNAYGGFYGYPYYGGSYPYPAYGGYYPYSAGFLNNYPFLGAGGYYPFQWYGTVSPPSGDASYIYPSIDFGYRGRPAYTGFFYGGYPYYGGAGGGPFQSYTPYALAGGNYGASPALYLGSPSIGGGYAPYSSALYQPTYFTGGQPFNIYYC